jgi:glycosyltransferase involved in cell wall biosynthesis
MGSGVANYTFNLVKNLLKYDKKNEYRLFYSSLRRPKGFYYLEELKKLGGKVYEYPIPLSVWKILWGKYHFFPVEWLIGKVDVFMSSDFLRPPLVEGTKGITTIHDLTWKIFPQYHTQDVIDAHTKKLEKTVKYEDIVIVDSDNTKKDLLKYYPEIKNVHVIHLAVGDQFKPVKDKKEIRFVLNKYRVIYPGNYLLYVGAIEPRKNLDKAIELFNTFIKIKKYSDYKFLIVGRAGWKNEDIFALIKKLKLEDKVIFVGFVEDKHLPHFYTASNAFIYLSEYEGFGLPPIEAAYCGTPTLLYDNSSLSEIFISEYPFTSKGDELKTLISVLKSGIDIKQYTYDYSWKKYCESFLVLLNFRV